MGGIPKLLYSGNLTRLLRRVRSDFDLILIDTPPVELYPESRVLGRISDGVVIVVRANRTNRNRSEADLLALSCRTTFRFSARFSTTGESTRASTAPTANITGAMTAHASRVCSD